METPDELSREDSSERMFLKGRGVTEEGGLIPLFSSATNIDHVTDMLRKAVNQSGDLEGEGE